MEGRFGASFPYPSGLQPRSVSTVQGPFPSPNPPSTEARGCSVGSRAGGESFFPGTQSPGRHPFGLCGQGSQETGTGDSWSAGSAFSRCPSNPPGFLCGCRWESGGSGGDPGDPERGGKGRIQGLRRRGLKPVPGASKNPRFSLFFKHFRVIASLGPPGLKSGFGRMTGCVTDPALFFLPATLNKGPAEGREHPRWSPSGRGTLSTT